MKNRKHRTITVFTLTVLILGVLAANVPYGDTTIARAAAQFLSSVAHNTTLTGDGTTAAPLGIANSGVGTNQLANSSVTASKIASGQVVKSLNGLTDSIILGGGPNISITQSGNTLTISSMLGLTSVSHDGTLTGDGTSGSPLGIAPGQTVRSFNNLTDNITLAAGSNISITPSGNTLTIAANIPPQPYINPKRVATLQWYEANETNISFPVGFNPEGIAFDGAHVWVVSATNSGSVTKIRTSDGANLGTFNVGRIPLAAAFDGANIWVSNAGDSTVSKLRASDGTNLGTFNVASFPTGLAFDGANIWVANINSRTVTKLRASDGANQGTFNVGNAPRGVAFDGANIWVTNSGGPHTVTKLRASDGVTLGTFSVGSEPVWIAFDGSNMWIANVESKSVTKLRASDGANLGTLFINDQPQGIAFDGAHIWVTGGDFEKLYKLRASDGTNLGTFDVPDQPRGVAFDGANVWVVWLIETTGSGNVMKF